MGDENVTNEKFEIDVNREFFSTNERIPSEGIKEQSSNELYSTQGINLKELSSQEGYFKEESFNEDTFKEESSQESSNDDIIQEFSFEEELFREKSTKEEGSSIRSSTIFPSSRSSSLYMAEFVQTSCESINSSINETLSPLKTSNLRCINIDTKNNSMSEKSSNIFEILQEIKPDSFHFRARSSSLLSSSFNHNPLFRPHRHSSYTPPRRYSDFRRYSLPDYYNFPTSLKLPRLITNDSIHEQNTSNSVSGNNNNNEPLANHNIITDLVEENNERILYGKYFFWFGFLFMPVWWLGSFYLPKPTIPEDYKWRKCCRKASIWGFVALVIIGIFAIIVDQWFKLNLLNLV
ncbi:6482_t:CDS:1 [Funneliformis caledonium]|uniref:6482_t:CDS:1 n=1 Tax=Funneliformis caledonium TaxID=1117310 RepID=A0A9N9AAF6_9GLOM|nr:6482_t:CDS:1 [Funneliformis caledonium]